MRHGILREALVQRGWNQRQAAEFLGIRQEVFGRWVNLKEFPKNISAELVIKLFELTGKMPEEIWPEEVFTEEFLAKPKKTEAIRDVPTERLLAQAGVYALLPSPDESFARQELKTVVDEALQKLTPRQESIIRQMFEDDASLAEIAAGFGGFRFLLGWYFRQISQQDIGIRQLRISTLVEGTLAIEMFESLTTIAERLDPSLDHPSVQEPLC